MKKTFFVFVFVLFAFSMALASGIVKNVIFMIGDGMGISSVDITRMALYGEVNYVDFEKTPYVGLMKTYSYDSFVTDSAAAGTAMSTGEKTNNGWLSVAPDGRSLRTLLEAARSMGKTTGIVTTVNVTDATAGAFVAHTESGNEQAIADQYADFMTADVCFGGGLEYFIPRTEPNSKRTDDRDLVREFVDAGYEFVSDPGELMAFPAPNGKMLGLFSCGYIPYVLDREYLEVDVPSLSQMTMKALQILSGGPNGFFLMIEGGKIGWANRAHDAGSTIAEIFEFNEAFRVVLDFLKKNPDTLIIVTSNQETGGLGLGSGKDELIPAATNGQEITAETLAGLVKDRPFGEIKALFEEWVGFGDLSPEEFELAQSGNARTIAEMISSRAEIGWTTPAHTGQSVPVYAFGNDAEFFTGVYDNTDIAKKIAAVAGYSMW